MEYRGITLILVQGLATSLFGQSGAKVPGSATDHLKRSIQLGWEGYYLRNLAPQIAITSIGEAPPMIGLSKGSAGFGSYVSYETKYGLLVQLDAQCAVLSMGYTTKIPGSTLGFGQEGVDPGKMSHTDLRATTALTVGYVGRFQDGFSLFGRVGLKQTWSLQPSTFSTSHSEPLANGTRVPVYQIEMDWNSDGGSFSAITAEVGLGMALSKSTEIRLLVGGDYYPNTFANGTFTVLPEDPQNSTSGTIRFSGSAWYVGMSFGLVVPWGK